MTGSFKDHLAAQVADRVATERRQQLVREHERDHRLAHDRRARQDRHVAALDVGAAGAAGAQVDGVQWPS